MESDRYDSLLDALEAARKKSFIHDFHLENDLLTTEDGSQFSSREISILEYHRFEGESDPEDESVIYLIETANGVRGTLVDAYGVKADEQVAEFLERVRLDEKKNSPTKPGAA